MDAEPPPPFPIAVSPRLPLVLSVVVAVLLAAHVAVQFYNYRVHELLWYQVELFDVDWEQSIPTWYSGFALLIAAGLLLGIAGRRRVDGERDARYWYGLAAGFVALSFDEVAGFHETLQTAMGGGWTGPGALLAAAVGVLYAPFLWRLPGRTRVLFAVAGAVFLGGVLGIESLTTELMPVLKTVDSLEYKLLAGLEEGLEMYGVVLFIHALLDYMRSGRRSAVIVSPDVRT
jgi:hypothetical protein